MRDYDAFNFSNLSQDEALKMARDVLRHLDPSTIENESMQIDYKLLKRKITIDQDDTFTKYELEKLVPLYKHWLRQVGKN